MSTETGRFWYLPDLPNETTAAANGSNGRVLDGPIIEPVNIYYFLLDFPFEAGNSRHKCFYAAFGQLLRMSSLNVKIRTVAGRRT